MSGPGLRRSARARDLHVLTGSHVPRVGTARTSAGGSVTVVASAGLREAVVSATGMPAPPAGRVYQVWVQSRDSSGVRVFWVLRDFMR